MHVGIVDVEIDRAIGELQTTQRHREIIDLCLDGNSHRIDREVKDPTTKEVLDRITTKVGEMTITSVRDKIATGTYSGAPAKVGYLARKKI